jgi:hypothetical protein
MTQHRKAIMSRVPLLLLAILPVAAFADTLQFQVGTGGAFASYARVQVYSPQGQRVFEGVSDGYGRVSASLPAGDYRVSVAIRSGGVRSATVHVAGADVLRVVTL